MKVRGVEEEMFEQLAWEVLDSLPEPFRNRLENVYIVVENVPEESVRRRVGGKKGTVLLGLYEGVPVSKRGIWYGSSPVTPDRITLFKKNIEESVRPGEAISEKIREVLIHEIGHHFGMNEDEIRRAGY